MKKSSFNVAGSRPETFQKHNLTEDVSSQILRIFQENFSFQCAQLTLDGVIKKHRQSMCKASSKMCNKCSLYAENYFVTGTPHNIEFLRTFLECFRDIDLFVNKDPMDNSCSTLFYFLSFSDRIQHYKLLCFKQGTISRAELRTLPNI